ncbi:lipopolysaccharide assembly protein LapB [uncultured Duncaniella sp.]|uniref:tetratricopeptide repeat protein n=1 Tax=uncultured Duncaniella sp. TaxID=2768039 RepID=UPI0026769466|nr:tetratricopeptide repeat protein [uncultured Duncaniella sp.]MCI9172389.1 tetratricopeptide repeat protein [Muribaculaceae bacterium]
MNKLSGLALLIGSTVLLTGCNKKMNQFAADYFSTNPNPLEVVGTHVPATVTGHVPAKFFVKNATVTVTPVLVYGANEEKAASMTFQGEKVRGNNPVISYENGGTVTIPVNYVYQPAMQKSELYLNFEVQQKGKQYVLPRVKVANGVVATAALANAGTLTPATANDKFQRIINEKYSADIHFLINQANLRKSELDSDEVLRLHRDLRAAAGDDRRQIEEINIESYASPEGSLEFNTKLAQNRETNTSSYLTKQLKKDNVTEFGELTANFTPEDWEGFQKLVAASNIQDKDLILSVLSMYKDPEQREREIRNLSSVFDQLAEEILPQLRYSRITANVNVIGKSDDELNKAYDTDPSTLTVDELLYTATLTDDLNRKKAVYTAATRLFPNDYRGYNNLGKVLYQQGDYDAAMASFKKAARLDANAPESQMNQGLVALVNDDYRAANTAFGKAAGLSDLSPALGLLYLKQGDVKAAVKAFGNDKSNNAALAQILNKDYSAAKSTLAAIPTPDATTYYLMAVLGARTGNEQMVTSNLRQAVKLDRNYATQAANDLEFARYNISSVL